MNPYKRKFHSTLVLLLIMSLMPLVGCGSDDAKNDGCPSDSYEANSTDIIIPPADTSQTLPKGFGGGSVTVTPLLFSVTDKDGNPRNKVCMIFYTDGTFYTDNSYSVPFTGANLIGVTDGQGKIILYWKTPVLPASSTTGDQKVDTFVQVYSGVLTKLFTYSWTIPGL